MKKPCGPPDMISDLPKNIIEKILIRLPISDAVGTSALSRKWRYKWVTLPHLVIDGSLWKKLLERRGQSGKCELVKVVYRLLLLHKGPLVKFAVEVDELDSCPDFDNWINFLSSHDIQEFTLSRAKTDPYKLPSHLFMTFQRLRHLKLRHCILRLPDGFKGFHELSILELEEVIMDVETLEWLVSSCPSLEQLTVTSYTPYGSIEIRAPKLINFSLTCEFASISFKHTLFLQEVAVSLCRVNKYLKHKSSNLVKFVRSLPAVTKLYLEGYFLEYLSMGTVPKKLLVHFKNLEVLHIDEMDFSNLDEVLCALCLITSSPKLKEVTIVAYAGDCAKDAVVEFFETQNLSHYSLKSLRLVTIEQLSNFEPELEFIKFILANSPELEEMEVIQSEDTVDEDELSLWREMLRFPRASPRAEVVIV